MVRSFHIVQASQYTNSLVEAPHILPVLFSFTTPAKYCFRAIASFSRFVTDMAPSSRPSMFSIPQVDSMSPRQSFFASFKAPSPRPEQTITIQGPEETTVAILEGSQLPDGTAHKSRRKSLKRALSLQMSRVGSVFRGQPPESPACNSPFESSVFAGVSTSPLSATPDVAGPRFQKTPAIEPVDERTAGDPAVYSDITVCFCCLDTRFLD
jgi:hypothetical protein